MVPPLSTGDVFQDVQRMPTTADSTKLYIYAMFIPTHSIPMIKFIS